MPPAPTCSESDPGSRDRHILGPATKSLSRRRYPRGWSLPSYNPRPGDATQIISTTTDRPTIVSSTRRGHRRRPRRAVAATVVETTATACGPSDWPKLHSPKGKGPPMQPPGGSQISASATTITIATTATSKGAGAGRVLSRRRRRPSHDTPRDVGAGGSKAFSSCLLITRSHLSAGPRLRRPWTRSCPGGPGPLGWRRHKS